MQTLNRLLSGQFEIIGGVKCYVGTPTVDYSKDKVILFLPDVFGIEFVNNMVSVFVNANSTYFMYCILVARR
jgi:hypothetical protein